MSQKIETEKSSGMGRAKDGGFLEKLWNFFNILERLDKEGDFATEARSCKIEGPFYSNAEYNYNIKLGIEDGDFPFKRGFQPRSRPRSRRRLR